MDEKDYNIIAALREDARVPIRKISKRVRMSESAVRKRMRRLERAGVIERYTVVVNFEAGIQCHGGRRLGHSIREIP